MSAVPLLSDDEVAPELRTLFERVAGQYGFVPNILRAMAHCPDLTATFVPFWAQVYTSPTIGPRLRALAALGTAKAQECTYCMAHMTASARRAGLSEVEICAIGEPATEQGVFARREALILELADSLTKDPDGISDELRGRLAEHFSDGELVNIVVAIGLYNLTSRFLRALAIDVEDVFRLDPVPIGGTQP